ncbi:MAG: GatB/YqeY domain-containing protein [Chloroflexi bacterium]|nr:GatB/YqeY domain-containing protein [Chloroflexota bacterium]
MSQTEQESTPHWRDTQSSPLRQKMADDLKKAMLEKAQTRVSTLRLLKSAIVNTEIARNAPLSDPDILGVIAKEVKQRQESIEAFKKGGRADLVAKEEAELAVLNEYLPRQLTRDEIVAEVRRVIQEVGAQGPRDKGKVMPKLMSQLKGKADGREINVVVTELLG